MQEGILVTITTPNIPCRIGADGLALIGTTANEIRGIRYAVPAEPAPAPAAPAEPAPAAPPAATPPAATPPAPATPADPPVATINPKTGKPFTPEETATRISELNAENKTAREAKEAAEKERDAATERSNNILKAAGFNPDGTAYSEIDPAKLQADLATRTAAADTTARENLVLRVSSSQEHRANADALLDSRDFSTKLAALKVDDREGVQTLVDEYVKNDAARFGITAASAASSGGTAHTGTPIDPTARKTKSAAIAEHYKG